MKYIAIIAFLLSWSWGSLAQTTTELNSVPSALAPGIATPVQNQDSVVAAIKPARKISYGLSVGTQFSRLLGTATYLEPSVMFPISKRFSGFASLNIITSFGANANYFGNDAYSNPYAPTTRNQYYIVNAGGNYIVNDRLNLTGSIWRDLSKHTISAPVNLLMPGGTNGMSFRANYKITEHLSVSGGFRYSNGNTFHNRWYQPNPAFGF
jgi:hypothetical protein